VTAVDIVITAFTLFVIHLPPAYGNQNKIISPFMIYTLRPAWNRITVEHTKNVEVYSKFENRYFPYAFSEILHIPIGLDIHVLTN